MSYPYEPQPEQDSITKWQLEIQEELQRFEFDLKGFYYNPEKKEWEKIPNSTQIINLQGVSEIINFARMHTGKTLFLSDLSEKEIYNKMQHAMDDFCATIGVNHKIYQVRNGISDLNIIRSKMEGFLFPALKRSQNGGERKFIQNTTNINVADTNSGNKQPKNFVDKLMAGFGGKQDGS